MKKQVNAVCGTAGLRDQASKEKILRDKVGKNPLAAGAGSNLPRLLARG